MLRLIGNLLTSPFVLENIAPPEDVEIIVELPIPQRISGNNQSEHLHATTKLIISDQSSQSRIDPEATQSGGGAAGRSRE